MFPRRFVFVAVAALIVLGLLLGAVQAGQRDAWMQGYMVGRLSDGAASGSGSAAPLMPYAYPGAYYGSSHFGGFGMLFGIGFLVLVFFGVSRLMCFHMRGMHGAPWQKPGEGQNEEHFRRWHRMPPWWQGWDQPPEEKSEQGSPEGGTGKA